MKYILPLVISLVFLGVPALAQHKSPLADLQAQIDGLQAQINALAVPEADAINGTWSGTLRSLSLDQFSSPLFDVNGPIETGPNGPRNSFTIPIIVNSTCSGAGLPPMPCVVQHLIDPLTIRANVPPGESLAIARSETSPITFTFSRSGTMLSGTAISPPDGGTATVVGAVVSSNFFLLKAIAPGPGSCSPGRFQGVASFSSIDPNRLIITGSGIDSDCSYSLFTINLVRQ